MCIILGRDDLNMDYFSAILTLGINCSKPLITLLSSLDIEISLRLLIALRVSGE
jgi:hypothetical protein